MKTEMINTEALLPQEWSGSYFIGEEEIEASTGFCWPAARSILRSRSPKLRDRVEDIFRARLGRKHAVLVNSGTGALNVADGGADVWSRRRSVAAGLPVGCLPCQHRPRGGIPGSWT